MESENITPEVTIQGNALNKVTPLSKYLAMILFIVMPFIGGWIGYRYAPVKEVEVEIPVSCGTETPAIAASTTDSLSGDYAAEAGVGKIHILKKDASHIYVTGQTILSGPDNSVDEVIIDARTGRLDGSVEMMGNIGIYTDSSDPTCKFTLQFDKVNLRISGGYETCDVTLANFDGNYIREH